MTKWKNGNDDVAGGHGERSKVEQNMNAARSAEEGRSGKRWKNGTRETSSAKTREEPACGKTSGGSVGRSGEIKSSGWIIPSPAERRIGRGTLGIRIPEGYVSSSVVSIFSR
ncbi:hypothetical protein R1flu_025902 [Riccia fluitans]|uniref:Uncharacterized protein n=1 Tax=Riccia fluitans TaxID=41844 RepID=A0ABD1XZ25_9MARC